MNTKRQADESWDAAEHKKMKPNKDWNRLYEELCAVLRQICEEQKMEMMKIDGGGDKIYEELQQLKHELIMRQLFGDIDDL
jgi:hypothetical protein